MTGIRAAIADYLAVRRALGYKLEDHGWLLADFATFLEDRDAGTITTEFALAWATRPGNALPSWWAARLRVVRGFARHVKAFDPATEIPPIGLLACSNRRARGHLSHTPGPARGQRHAPGRGDPPGPARPGYR